MKKTLLVISLSTSIFANTPDCTKADTTYERMSCRKLEVAKAEKHVEYLFQGS